MRQNTLFGGWALTPFWLKLVILLLGLPALALIMLPEFVPAQKLAAGGTIAVVGLLQLWNRSRLNG